MAQNRKRDVVTFLIRSTFWPKILQRDVVTFLMRSTLWPKLRSKAVQKQQYGQKNCSKTVKIENVTVSHSLLGQLYGPRSDSVTMSHSLLGQHYGPNRDQKLFKNSNTVKKTVQKQ